MKAETVKALLPVIIAFANRETIQFKSSNAGSLVTGEWLDINPDTTEFRIDTAKPYEWRVKP